MLTRGKNIAHDIDVGEVWRDDDNRVDVVVGEQLGVVLIGNAAGSGMRRAGFPRAQVGVSNRNDRSVVEGENVLDVLDAHHPGADDSIPDVLDFHVLSVDVSILEFPMDVNVCRKSRCPTTMSVMSSYQASASLVNGAPRRLGPDGPSIGALGYGTWRLTADDTAANTELIEAALAAGMNLIDTADVYGLDHGGTGFGQNEERLGDVLAFRPELRDQIVLATKGGIMPPIPYDSSPAYLRSAVDASLARLQVERIDLWQIHRPDMFTHPAAVAETLDALIAEGKIGMVGISNFTVDQYDALAAHLDAPIVSTQPEFSVAQVQPMRDGTFDRSMRDGVVPLAWSPLAGGRLFSGEGIRPELLAVLDRLAEREGVDRSAIAIAFVLAHPAQPVALLGTQTPERLRAAPAAVEVHLDRTDVYEILVASEGVPLP